MWLKLNEDERHQKGRRSMRLQIHLLALMGFLLLPAYASAQNQVATKENLDLPFDAFGISEDEEEAPEVVFFYGQQYEGDGFFFALDRSGSTRGSQIEIEKREAIRTVTQFSNRVQFGFVFYDQGILNWPGGGQPAEASQSQKTAAIAWLTSIQSGSGSCAGDGMIKALKYADRSSAKRNVVVYLGDGGTGCPSSQTNSGSKALTNVTGANFKRHQINSICVGTDISQADKTFCQTLARMNGGTYKHVPN